MISFNGRVITYNDRWIDRTDPYNPLNLPPYTIRVKFVSGYRPTIFDLPTFPRYRNADSLTLVNADENIWDITMNDTNWIALFFEAYELEEVLGANSTGVTNMESMFLLCSSVTSISLFDTSNVTNMAGMFQQCTSLSSINLYNTSNVIDTRWMFTDCVNVETGSLALYQQMSSQANPPTNHSQTFKNCGSNTQTGAAELVQIPDDWK